MTFSTTLKASVAAACVIAFAGCTDLKPIQAQIDDLKSQVAKLQSDTAKAAERCQRRDERRTERQLGRLRRAEHGESGALDRAAKFAGHRAINEKIDRMFKKSVSK